MRAAAYLRVSTDTQDCDSQRHAIQQWLAARPAMDVVWYVDDGISGKTEARPEFQRLCADVEAGLITTVVTYRLDRLSRKAVTALRLLMDWAQWGVAFYATEQPILSTGKEDPFRLTKLAMFSELAEIERENIVSRVRSGLAAARARGVRLGAPPRIDMATRAEIKRLRRAGAPVAELAERYGVVPSTISKICKR